LSRSFCNSQTGLISSPVLSFPIEEGKFILDTNASNHGISSLAILSQKQEGEEKLIAHFLVSSIK